MVQTPLKTNSFVLQEVFNCVVVFEEQSLNHENTLRVNMETQIGKKKIPPVQFSSITSIGETQTDLSSYLQTLCLLFPNTQHNETNIILKETLDMLCICKFDFIGIAVK